MDRRLVLRLAIAFEGGALLLALTLGWLWGTPALGRLRSSWAAAGQGAMASLPLLVGLLWVSRSRWPPIVRLRRTVDEVVDHLFAGSTLLDLAVISALAGAGEEALFRGFVQTAIAEVSGTGVGVMVAALLFGLTHFISPSYAAYATLVGVYFGFLLNASDNLLVPVLAHALYDFIALAFLIRSRRKEPSAGPI